MQRGRKPGSKNPNAGRKPGIKNKTHVNTKSVIIRLEEEVILILKNKALKEETTMNKLISIAATEYSKK